MYMLLSSMLRASYIIPTLAFIALGSTIAASAAETFPGDVSVTQAFQHTRASWMDTAMLTFSSLGNTEMIFLILLCTGLSLYAQSKHLHALALVAAGFGSILVPLIKNIIERPRPLAEDVEVFQSANSYSFPSGHAFTSMVVFGAIFYFAGHLCNHNRWMTGVLRAILIIAIVGVGASRIYLGMHWTSDVLAGYLMGGLTLAAVLATFKWLRDRGNPNSIRP